MKRIVTAALALPLVGLAIFGLSGVPWLVVLTVAIQLAVIEYVRLARAAGAARVVWALPALVLGGVVLLCPELRPWLMLGSPEDALLFAGWAVSGLLAVVVLLARGSVSSAFLSLGALAFGLPFFTVAIVSLYRIHQLGPWVLVLLLAFVWAGDSAAYYCGTAWGRAKLAPVVSPNKSWVGAAASFLTALAVGWAWCHWRLGGADAAWLAAVALGAVAAQLGDLVESLLKRSVGVKDSGTLLPGHGGMLDRLDALLLAAPVFWLVLRTLGAA